MEYLTAQKIQVQKPLKFKRHYVFAADNATVAEMEYAKAYVHKALIKIGREEWTIRRGGFWKPYIEISTGDNRTQPLKIPMRWNYKLKMEVNGIIYSLQQLSCWKNTWAWLDDRKNPVVEIKSKMMSYKNRGSIFLHQTNNTKVLLMALVGWFAIINYEDEAMVAVAV